MSSLQNLRFLSTMNKVQYILDWPNIKMLKWSHFVKSNGEPEDNHLQWIDNHCFDTNRCRKTNPGRSDNKLEVYKCASQAPLLHKVTVLNRERFSPVCILTNLQHSASHQHALCFSRQIFNVRLFVVCRHSEGRKQKVFYINEKLLCILTRSTRL